MNTNETTAETEVVENTVYETPVYEIPARNLPALQSKLDEMNRRAVKLGCEPTVLKVVGEFDVVKHREHTRIKYTVHYLKVEVTGNTPKLNGWQLMAAVEKLETGENMVRCVPGKTVPEAYRNADTHCDHCHTARYRKEVFILQHDDGRWAQVGRSCIADFLGHKSVDNICGRAAWDMDLAEEMGEASDEDYCGGRGEIVVEMTEFVAATAICVRRLGWLSRGKAAEMIEGPTPTSDIAWRICTSDDRYTKELIEESSLIAEERDIELTTAAIAWGASHGTENTPDYLYNLGVAVRLGYVTHKTCGIVASVIAAYLREQERIGEMGMKAKKRPSVHVGVVGARQGFAGVLVKSLKYIESQFGVKTLCRFEDSEGNTLVWWCSGDSDWLKEGETIDLTGTIKKHTEYKGWLQTELSRVAAGLPKVKTPRKKKAAVAVPAPLFDTPAATETECPF